MSTNSTSSKSVATDDKKSSVTIASLQEVIKSLQSELESCKQFFGYESDMSIEKMQEYKDECEEEERILCETDKEYGNQRKKSDQMVDMVLKLGEYQYALSEVYSKIKKYSIAGTDTLTMRKLFVSSFMSLKESMKEECIPAFFKALHQFIKLQEDIDTTDRMIKNIRFEEDE